MGLNAGKRLGPYEIVEAIGAGGMGEVYRALDTRLERTVAIKVLPPEMANREDVRQRFEREAKAVSALNHPHICVLHDVGRHDDIDFIVMEYLEGETLAARLARGRLPLAEALEYAMQIADALDKAHRQGVVHRDLKPGNIMITRSGAKLLDFGLAKLRQQEGNQPLVLSRAPTQGADLTAQGTIVGTIQYMSPEQLDGVEADARSDIFSFGATLYEMVTGRRAFQGKSPVSVMAAILEHDPPPITSSEHLAPPMLDYVVKTCLAKNPEKRWQTVGDLTLQLRWIAEGGAAVTAAPVAAPASGRWIERAVWGVALGGVLGSLAAAMWWKEEPRVLPPMRFNIPTPNAAGLQVSVSPDGRHVVSVATSDRGGALSLHSLEHSTAQLLKGTEATGPAFDPFWSPDSRYIGFFADGKLKKVDISGAPPQTVTDAVAHGNQSTGGSWSHDGTIIFDQSARPIYRVAAAGGTAIPATVLDETRQETAHVGPQFLPGGRQFIYVARSRTAENNAIYVGSLDSKDRKRLMDSQVVARFAPPRWFLFMRADTLMAQELDLQTLELVGDAKPLAEGVGRNLTTRRAGFSASLNGVLVYRAGRGSESQLMWLDRSGSSQPRVVSEESLQSPKLSPDGQRVAANLADSGPPDIWLFDLIRNTPIRFTFNDAADSQAIWSPDGKQIVFNSTREGVNHLYLKNSGGATDEELLLKTAYPKGATDWSSDGKTIIYHENNPKTLTDIWMLPLSGDRKPVPLIQTAFNENNGRLSPDGKWLVYVSNESGRSEIYLQSFPPSGNKWKISSMGGVQPRWRRDGKEVFYISAVAGGIMGVDVKSHRSPNQFETDIPRLLVRASVVSFDVSLDGQQFLVDGSLPLNTEAPPTLNVILNWVETLGLKK